MSVKSKIFEKLSENKNKPVSGEELAKELGVTRTAVWKAINALKKEGHEVIGVNNSGYTLKKFSDNVSKEFIEKNIKHDLTVEVVESIDSTNNRLKIYAGSGETRDYVLIAEEQTGGRGRSGRGFFSPKGTGLYISFLLHPKVDILKATRLTTIASVAEAMAIEEVTKEKVSIKWVNDLLINGKKISGILTEASTSMENGSLEYVICGIGINLYEPVGGFPEEIKAIAGSVTATKQENLKNELLVSFINNFMNFYKEFLEDKLSYIEEYKKRSIVIGKEVTLLTPDHEEISEKNKSKAKVLDIDENCHLIIEYNDGSKDVLSNGEISVRI